MSADALNAMSKRVPCSVQQLATMPGVGLHKAGQYAQSFLPIIWEAIVKHDIAVPVTHVVPASVYQVRILSAPRIDFDLPSLLFF